MAKRFTDTDKWKKPFIRGLQGAYKLLWLYILDDCDHAGIWQVDIDVANIKIGETINTEEALEAFGDHVMVIDGGEKWYIPDFIEFQYGELNPDNRAHASVLSILNKYKIKPLGRSLQGRKDKDKDKDKDMDKDKDAQKKFDEFRKLYPGTKRGNETEFDNFCKKHKDWPEILPKMPEIIQKQIKSRESLSKVGSFVPEWKNLQTWINQRCWEEEAPIVAATSPSPSLSPIKDNRW